MEDKKLYCYIKILSNYGQDFYLKFIRMENEKSLFNLDIDSVGKNHLRDTAKWARFLAIVGFIGLALILVISIIVAVSVQNKIKSDFGEPVNSGELVGTILGAVVVGVIYFFPCYFLLKFGNRMIAALDTDDGASLNESFRNLKITFRYVGVLTIIFVALFILGLLTNLSNS